MSNEITTKQSFFQKQSDDTFDTLVEIFNDTNDPNVLISQLESFTKKRFGISLKILNSKDTKITEFKINDQNISITELDKLKFDKQTTEKEQSINKQYRGTVDYKKLKVANDLSDVIVRLDLNFGRITVDYSNKEKADIFLFVVGNAFVALANYHKLKLVSKILSEIELNDNKKDIKVLVSKFKEINSEISEDDIKKLIDDKGNICKTNLVVFGAKFIKNVTIDLSNISNDSIEFTNSFSDANKETCVNAITISSVVSAIIFIFRAIIGIYFIYCSIINFYLGTLVLLTPGMPIGFGIAFIIAGMVCSLIGLWVLPSLSDEEDNTKEVDTALSKIFGKFNFKTDLMVKVQNVFNSAITSTKSFFSLEEINSFNLAFESVSFFTNDKVLPNLSKKKLSLEIIDYQNDDFGNKLEAIITKIVSNMNDRIYKDRNNLRDTKEILDIQILVEKRLGLKIRLITDDMIAAIMPFYSNKNHILLSKFWRNNFSIKGQDELLKESINKEGSVDLVKAKLGGIFSQYVNEVFIHFNFLINDLKLSPAEITAILLHELGHGFYVCEYSDRLETINQVLANIATEVLSKKKKDLTYVYRELEKVSPDITKEEVEILLGEDRVIAGSKWFEVIVGVVKHQLNVDTYDNTSFEQLADNFPSRFGYGRSAIIALDKLHLYVGDASKSKGSITILQLINGIFITCFLLGIVCATLPVSLLFAFFFGIVCRLNGSDMRDFTYDELKQRYIRIRNDSVELLKKDKLSKELTKSILEDIYAMDSIIKDTHQWSTIMNKLSDFIFSNARKSKTSIEEQKTLEELLSNNLFVLSAQLRLA